MLDLAEFYFPFTSIEGDRKYNATDFATYYYNIFTSGVIATVREKLRVSESAETGMRVDVHTGSMFIQGHLYLLTEPMTVNITPGSSTADRTDSIVAQLDTLDRKIKIIYKQGSTSVRRDENYYEMQLAVINVPRNATSLFNSHIIDKRADLGVCGYSKLQGNLDVAGMEQHYESLLEQLVADFEQLATTNQSNLEQLLTDQQALFQNWLTNLQNQLGENQAANLQKQIDYLSPTANSFTFIHNLGMYPQVQVLFHEYGIGTVPLEEQPEGISWDGTAPITLPNAIEHSSRKEFNVKLPVGYSLMNPTVTAIDKHSFLLNEGIRSIEIRIIVEPDMKELSRNIVVLTGEGYDNLEHKDKDTLYVIVAGGENE